MKQFTQQIDNANVWVEEFDSLADNLMYAKDNKKRKESDTKSPEKFKWTGSADLDSAVDMGLTGWHEIRPRVDSLFARVDSNINLAMGDMFESRFNVCGDSADIDRYLMGDPECMIDYVDVPQARMGRVVRLLINGSANSGISPDKIMERGVIVCTLIDVLNRMNVGVEVYLENCTGVWTANQFHSLLVKLHTSEQLLDVNNLMFAIAHPSMLRRVSFSVMEKSQWQYAKEIAKKGGGYGQAKPCKLDKFVNADVVMQNFEFGNGEFEDDALKYVMSTVTGLGLVEC